MKQKQRDLFYLQTYQAARAWWLILGRIVGLLLHERLQRDLRQLDREEKRQRKLTSRVSHCGIRFYAESSGWTHCHGCQRPLVWYDSAEEAETHRRTCRRA